MISLVQQPQKSFASRVGSDRLTTEGTQKVQDFKDNVYPRFVPASATDLSKVVVLTDILLEALTTHYARPLRFKCCDFGHAYQAMQGMGYVAI